MSDNQSDNWDTWGPKKEAMNYDDLPPLPKASFYISNGETWNTPYYASHQLRAVQREAYEAGKRRAALDTVHAIDRELMMEPVAYRHWMDEDGWEYFNAPTGEDCKDCQPLYAHPPKTATVSATLTDEEIDDLACKMVKGGKSVNWLARAVEAALKEKQCEISTKK